jgi:uncharacterized protein YndB with AHSA1/START domain
MAKEFTYTIYIQSTPEKIWEAITTPEFTKLYWGHQIVSDWAIDSKWEMLRNSDLSLNVIGKVVESNPPHRLVLTWAEADKLADQSHVVFEIEAMAEKVRLNVTHTELSDYMAARITHGWPIVLSGLKTLLETNPTLSAAA